jgi:hypothetical protein
MHIVPAAAAAAATGAAAASLAFVSPTPEQQNAQSTCSSNSSRTINNMFTGKHSSFYFQCTVKGKI